MKPKTKLLVIMLLVMLAVGHLAQAQIVTCGGYEPGTGAAQAPCQLTGLIGIILKVINIFLGFSWLVAMFFIFWGGWGMVTAFGNEEHLKEAKTTFRNAIVGFFMIMTAFILINFITLELAGFSLDPNQPNSIFKLFPFP